MLSQRKKFTVQGSQTKQALKPGYRKHWCSVSQEPAVLLLLRRHQALAPGPPGPELQPPDMAETSQLLERSISEHKP